MFSRTSNSWACETILPSFWWYKRKHWEGKNIHGNLKQRFRSMYLSECPIIQCLKPMLSLLYRTVRFAISTDQPKCPMQRVQYLDLSMICTNNWTITKRYAMISKNLSDWIAIYPSNDVFYNKEMPLCKLKGPYRDSGAKLGCIYLRWQITTSWNPWYGRTIVHQQSKFGNGILWWKFGSERIYFNRCKWQIM